MVEACLEKGRKILVMSECSSKHLGAFHIDEGSVGWGPEGYPWDQKERMDVLQAKYANHGRAFLRNNIVDCVKSGHLIGNPEMQAAGQGGTLRYYTFNMICHDDYTPIVCGDRLTLAYQAIFAPFIPIWWIGEEWNNPLNLLHPGVMIISTKSIGMHWKSRKTGHFLRMSSGTSAPPGLRRCVRGVPGQHT